ncbi:MAG: hypothetical protein ACR2F6_17845 [Mycobacteriales bacterium]
MEPDLIKRNQLVFEIIKIHMDEGPFFQGTAADVPRTVAVRENLMNVPVREALAQGGFVNPWIHPVPVLYDPETWYWKDPASHAS